MVVHNASEKKICWSLTVFKQEKWDVPYQRVDTENMRLMYYRLCQ
jgi:hypothetical protein